MNLIYEINTLLWLKELSHKYKIEIKLNNISEKEITNFKDLGFDAIWFMGVWSRSKKSGNAILKDAKLMQELESTVPDLKLDDIVSSPYAITDYKVNSLLGNRHDLLGLKRKLNKNGINLILDFVPNHVALDHPWLKKNPEYFILGNDEDIKNHPDLFFRHPDTGYIFAYGKDPNFPAWQDVVQLNYFNPQTRIAMTGILLDIVPLCDGLRCDMAMLVLNRVQKEIWKERILYNKKFKEPEREFWQEIIPPVKKLRPEFLFIAEVYWGLEAELVELGFDYVYDKTFYDYLRDSNIARIKEHIAERQEAAAKKLKFIENHDEARAVSVFGLEKSKVAAFLLSVSCGTHLFHQGQLEGFKIKFPIWLNKAAGEKIDEGIFSFYKRLLAIFKDISLNNDSWELTTILPAWEQNQTFENFIGTFKEVDGNYYLAVANYSDVQSQCYMHFDVSAIQAEELVFKDLFGQSEYIRNREQIMQRGLYLDMPEYSYHLFKILDKPACRQAGSNYA